ncbi:ATP-binding cassette domain-containing protein [Actinomadura alba]|uniref:ABC transporter ATP-binding protein n=1 Tax=Actinomadura alba TaxID=406431 RepID=A0ABR7LI55_9ACTN|nr:ABC transporter ATP-binding protein [Actinomadura alba]MBC6464456.1 ABC transporter ATP-binding protein [Actinomadura alba]
MTNSDRRAADRLLTSVVRRGGGWVVVLAVATTLTALAEILLPAALGRAVDAVMAGSGTGHWVAACTVLIAVCIAGEALGDLAAGMSRARATAWLRHTLLGHVLALGPRGARRFESGDLVGRVVAGADDAGNAASAAAMAAASALPAVGSLIALALIDPLLAAAFLTGMAVLAVMLRGFVREASDVTARYQRAQGDIAARLLDALAGARTVAAAGTQRRETQRVLGPLADLRAHGFAMWRTQTRMTVQGALVMPLIEVAVLATAGLMLFWDRITLGELLAAGRYAVLGSGLDAVVLFANRVVRGRAAARRAVEVLREPPTAYGTRTLPSGGGGRLELRGVTARPGGEPAPKGLAPDGPAPRDPVLRGVDLIVPAGAAVAVVGRSGAGKSLLAALAGRLTEPEAGEVLLDGVPLRELDRAALRRAVGYAFERPVLVGDTLADVIGFGAVVSSPRDLSGRIGEAARAACADTFIRRLPRGYATPLKAAPMSGGEVQRLGLARAFAQAERLLILDDATSSLDTATELQVSRALTKEFGDRTRLIVAHRAATASRADLVAWIDEGAIRAFGPHRELWRDPAYRAVFRPADAPADRDGTGAPPLQDGADGAGPPVRTGAPDGEAVRGAGR